MKKPIKKIFLCLDIIALTGSALVHTAFTPAAGFISSAAAVVMDAATGEVLYEKAMKKTMYPASTTKVMTALLLIEYATAHGWELTAPMSEYAVESIGQDASNIGLAAGDTLTLRECLYAIMLSSANEVCVAVAEYIAGGISSFADAMNRRAVEIGCAGTNFTNPHGLPDRNHVTTAYDIALITREALNYPDFIEAISTVEYAVYPNGQYDRPLILTNKNMLIQDSPYYRDYVVGGKTGYTSAAKHTLVSYAVKDGAELICVAMRAPNYMTYPDTISLLEYNFKRLSSTAGNLYTNITE